MTQQEAQALQDKLEQLRKRQAKDVETLQGDRSRSRRSSPAASAEFMRRQTQSGHWPTPSRSRSRLAADAEPGQRELRVETPRGLSNPLAFYVGRLPEFREQEPEPAFEPQDFARGPEYATRPGPTTRHHAAGRGQRADHSPRAGHASLPADRFTPGDVDRYRFQARKGQQLVIAASARELIPYLADAVPGWFQATLTLVRRQGKRAGLRRRLPLPSRSGAVLQGSRGRPVRGRDQGRDLPRPRGFRLSHHHRRAAVHHQHLPAGRPGRRRRPPSSSPAGTCRPTR